MKRILLALVLSLLLILPAAAYEVPEELSDLDGVMADFMAANGLSQNNFSLSYYNTVTGESWAFNEDAMMVAASTFKLPLNMYYYEMERDGEIASDAVMPRTGIALDEAHRMSLVDSNNEHSLAMLYNLGDFRTYKEKMRDAYFTMPEETIHDSYYYDNYYCTHMMMDALKYLYDHSEDFEEMLGYMKQAQPDQYFRAGVTEYEVAHKYGWFDGAVNDVGIIYTEEPFLLAVYTQDVWEQVVSDAAELLTAYNVANAAAPVVEEPEETEEPALPDMSQGEVLEIEMVPVKEPEPEAEMIRPEPAPEPEAPAEEPAEAEPAFEWWMVLVALGVFGTGGGIVRACNLKKLEEKYEKKYADKF